MTNTENKLIGTRRTSLTTMMAALLAGSLVATAGSFAYAKTDGQAFDPAKFQQRIETRVLIEFPPIVGWFDAGLRLVVERDQRCLGTRGFSRRFVVGPHAASRHQSQCESRT